MKKLFIIAFTMLAMLLAFTSVACSGSNKISSHEDMDNNSKMIVCYFSATGTTAKQAERIARLTGADIVEIVPEIPYTDADLDWRDSHSRSSVEMADQSSRPAIKVPAVNFSDYSVVFIGYPNWWNTCPRIINTFIESAGLEGKTVVPFMTSGGSGISDSETQLRADYPDVLWEKGLLMNNVSDGQIEEWLKTIL